MPQLVSVTETITTKEAAHRVGVAVSTFHNWVAAGRIAPARQLPGARGHYLFAAEDVERLRVEHVEHLKAQLAAVTDRVS